LLFLLVWVVLLLLLLSRKKGVQPVASRRLEWVARYTTIPQRLPCRYLQGDCHIPSKLSISWLGLQVSRPLSHTDSFRPYGTGHQLTESPNQALRGSTEGIDAIPMPLYTPCQLHPQLIALLSHYCISLLSEVDAFLSRYLSDLH